MLLKMLDIRVYHKDLVDVELLDSGYQKAITAVLRKFNGEIMVRVSLC